MLRYSLLLCCVLYFSDKLSAQQSYDVFVRESPAGAGEIRPGIGIHTFKAREKVTLITAPKAGYRFVGWLGDVQDAASNRTNLIVDGPKIIIAVFERDEYEFEENSPQISVGPQALYPHQVSYTNNSGSWNPPFEPDEPDWPKPPRNDPPPVPGGPEVPEPATMILLGLGTWIVRAKTTK